MHDNKSDSVQSLSAADRRYIMDEAKAVALRENMIDPSDVKNGIDISELRIDAFGDVVGLQEKITALKSSKPHWFKIDDSAKNDRKRSSTPQDRKDANPADKSVDWSKASDEDFRAQMSRYGVR